MDLSQPATPTNFPLSQGMAGVTLAQAVLFRASCSSIAHAEKNEHSARLLVFHILLQ
jgi:hypothetical protein